MLRTTHLVIPQARETHEVIIDKSFWTWGGEIGVNEHGARRRQRGDLQHASAETGTASSPATCCG